MKKIVLLLLILTGCYEDNIYTDLFRLSYDRRYCVVSSTQQTAEIVCTRTIEKEIK